MIPERYVLGQCTSVLACATRPGSKSLRASHTNTLCCCRWPGRVSACYYAASTDEAMVTLVRIANMWPSEVLARLDLHVVRDLPGLPPDTERGGYPINFLRNVAWNYVRTPYVFLLDIDFMPSLGFLEKLPKQLYHR